MSIHVNVDIERNKKARALIAVAKLAKEKKLLYPKKEMIAKYLKVTVGYIHVLWWKLAKLGYIRYKLVYVDRVPRAIILRAETDPVFSSNQQFLNQTPPQ